MLTLTTLMLRGGGGQFNWIELPCTFSTGGSSVSIDASELTNGTTGTIQAALKIWINDGSNVWAGSCVVTTNTTAQTNYNAAGCIARISESSNVQNPRITIPTNGTTLSMTLSGSIPSGLQVKVVGCVITADNALSWVDI